MIAVGLLAVGGCKKDDPSPPSSAPAPGSEAPGQPTSAASPTATPAAPETGAPASKPTAPEATPEAALSDARKTALSGAFKESWCLLQRRDRAGLSEIFSRHGFEGAAAFSTAWDQARELDPEWAEKTSAQVVGGQCPTPD